MQQLEKWITDNITNHNQDTMKNLIQETMKEMLKPIQDSIDNLLVLKRTWRHKKDISLN